MELKGGRLSSTSLTGGMLSIPKEMGGIVPAGTKSITANGTYDVTNYASADVNVPTGSINLQTKSVNPTTSAQTVTPDSGYDGLSSVSVGAIQTQTKSVSPTTSAQSVTPDSGKYLTRVNVGKILTETATVTPTTSQQTITPQGASSYLSQVTVEAMSLGTKTITENGTYSASSDNKDGFSEVTVNVSGGGGGGIDVDDIAKGSAPSGAVTLTGTKIAGYGLAGRTAITSLTGANITTVEGYCLQASPIASVSFPNLVTVVNYGFSDALVAHFDLPSCTTLGNRCCQNNNALTAINLPALTTMGDHVFYRCTKLVTAVFPALTTAQSACFDSCSELTTADFGSLSSIAATTFSASSKFNTLILRNTTVVALANVNAFNNSCFASGKAGGTIYVPSALISSYQSATNWSTVNGYGTITWAAIEGSQYENYYADGTAIS